jgi:hypothetical protein
VARRFVKFGGGRETEVTDWRLDVGDTAIEGDVREGSVSGICGVAIDMRLEKSQKKKETSNKPTQR